MRRPRISIGGLMASVLVVAIGLAALHFASETWAAILLLATLGFLVLTFLMVAYRRGEGRASWLGTALFGWGYLTWAGASSWDDVASKTPRDTPSPPRMLTSIVLDALRLDLGPDPDAAGRSVTVGRILGRNDPPDAAILAALDLPLSMPFPTQTALGDVIRYLRVATIGPDLKEGLPIYIDPEGLREAGASLDSPVVLSLEGVPLKNSLRLLLGQIGLVYRVERGVMTFTAARFETVDRSYRRIGHCLFALLAAGLGGLAGRAVHDSRDRPDESTTRPANPERARAD